MLKYVSRPRTDPMKCDRAHGLSTGPRILRTAGKRWKRPCSEPGDLACNGRHSSTSEPARKSTTDISEINEALLKRSEGLTSQIWASPVSWSCNLGWYAVLVAPGSLWSKLVVPSSHQVLISDAHPTMIFLITTKGVLRAHTSQNPATYQVDEIVA